MKKTKILVHGTHPEILQTVLRLINKNEAWEGEGSTDEETVIEYFQKEKYDLVMLGGGISTSSEKKLRAVFNRLNPQVKIIQHYGGGSGLLKSEIETALAAKRNNRFSVVDNPFET
ncbi:MAG: hypothetical protein AAFZ15_00105 [Bacteroidota bacterium]